MKRLDDLHREGRKIYQDSDMFCFGADAVLLAWYACVKRGGAALDLCAGNGIVSILMEARNSNIGAKFDGIELLEENVALAEESVEYNGLGGVVSVRRGDIRDMEIIPAGTYDTVTANPPYMRAGAGAVSGGFAKAAARHEVCLTLPQLCAAASKALKYGGGAYIAHRPERLTDLLCGCRGAGIEPKRLKFARSYALSPPRLALLCAVKGGKPGIIIEPPVTLYKENGEYTDEVYDIYYG